MDSRLFNHLRFLLERWIQGGAWHQLLLTAALIGLIAVAAGILAWATSGAFNSFSEAIWWSFLRLSDPGYLGDDEGILLRIISTVVTVLGYVLFLGSLIAIMTQWLNGTIRRLESGLSPITASGHTLILGWTNRTPNLLHELVEAQDRHKTTENRARRIVILASSVTPELRAELRETLGEDYDRWRIILRSGSSMRIEHLRRVDFEHAHTIIVPGSDYSLGGYEVSDARVVKSLLTLAHHLEPSGRPEGLPHVVAEVLDTSRLVSAERSYPGRIQAVASDAFVSRLIAQNTRHPGLSTVYTELLTHSTGNEIYAASFPELAGLSFGDLQVRFNEAILIGIVRHAGNGFEAVLNPPSTYRLQEADRCVGIARSQRSFAPTNLTQEFPEIKPDRVDPTVTTHLEAPRSSHRRILILGWNHRFHQLLKELSGFRDQRIEIEAVSTVPLSDRANGDDGHRSDTSRMTRAGIHHVVADYTEETVLRRLNISSYDNILLLGNNWMETEEDTDAQTLLALVLLRSLLAELPKPPPVLVELMNPATAPLVDPSVESLISPVVVSHVLAHVALQPELNAVITALFASTGSDIFFRTAGEFGLTGRTMSFAQVMSETAVHGKICIGLRTAQRGTSLNPPRGRTWTFDGTEHLILIGMQRETALSEISSAADQGDR